MCRHLALIARGVGHEATKVMIMPQLVELSNDEVSDVRLAAIETVVNLLSVLDDEICTQTIVPLVIKSCDQVSKNFWLLDKIRTPLQIAFGISWIFSLGSFRTPEDSLGF